MKPLAFVLFALPTAGLCGVDTLGHFGPADMQLHTDANGEPTACAVDSMNDERQHFQVIYYGSDPIPNFLVLDNTWELGSSRVGQVNLAIDSHPSQMMAKFEDNIVILLPPDGQSSFHFLSILERSQTLEVQSAAGQTIATFPLDRFPEAMDKARECASSKLASPDSDPFQ